MQDFHSVTTRFLYLMNRALLYLEPLVSFLNTQVSKNDEDDLKNMKRSLLSVNNTIEDKLVIGERKFPNCSPGLMHLML